MIEKDKKKSFLYRSSLLFDRLIQLAPDDSVRRLLAFRIIVNTMVFEAVVGDRQHQIFRKIRNVLLAHKQEDDFFEGYKATEQISNNTIKSLLSFMHSYMTGSNEVFSIPELDDAKTKNIFESTSQKIMEKFYEEEIKGFRYTNNFLLFSGEASHEISKNDLAGFFFRYSSSVCLMKLSMFFLNNLNDEYGVRTSEKLMKLDFILHAQNMADSIIKDRRNCNSIDGLLEIIEREQIGDSTELNNLKNDVQFQNQYRAVRDIRNKLIAHIDNSMHLKDLLAQLDAIDLSPVYEFDNKIDLAVYKVAQSDMAIKARYNTINTRLNDENVIDIQGLKIEPYYD